MVQRILAISGSVRMDSSNVRIIRAFSQMAAANFEVEIYDRLGDLPHFNPDLDTEGSLMPASVKELREKIEKAQGVLICTPEYVFSLPGSLKNALEWTVSTTVFSDKPVAAIIAAASGVKAQEAIQLILKTLGAKISDDCFVLIQGARGKIMDDLQFSDDSTRNMIAALVRNFSSLVNASVGET